MLHNHSIDFKDLGFHEDGHCKRRKLDHREEGLGSSRWRMGFVRKRGRFLASSVSSLTSSAVPRLMQGQRSREVKKAKTTLARQVWSRLQRTMSQGWHQASLRGLVVREHVGGIAVI
ncbi:unnamed protein product [Musa acuminata subsp. burmannicoides]